jgi:TPP-dependent indolepyruvate ferredoxin oxidoreductase alpha subunit
VSDAIFKTKSGQSTFFLPARELQKGSLVVADDGQTLLEVVTTPERHETDTIVELHAGDAVLCVTKDHRIPRLLEKSGQRHEVQAAELKNRQPCLCQRCSHRALQHPTEDVC